VADVQVDVTPNTTITLPSNNDNSALTAALVAALIPQREAEMPKKAKPDNTMNIVLLALIAVILWK
jgi:hypothetical protein